MTTASTAAVPDKSSDAPTRSKINCATGSLYWYEMPMSPWNSAEMYFQNWTYNG